MDKNESISLTPVMNGFQLCHSYRTRQEKISNDTYAGWDYNSDEYNFGSWTDMVSWLTSNPMSFPPTKI